MTDREPYDDPAVARRFREWIDDAAPAAAPERLVFAVMDEVERQPRRRTRSLGPFRLFNSLPQYAALTVVIAIGVAAGILLTRPDLQGPAATPSPSAPQPSASPSATWPTLPTLGQFTVSDPIGPSALAFAGSSLWVGTPDGSLVELDPASGSELSRTPIGVEPIWITPYRGALWIGSGSADLVWVDAASREVRSIPGAGGPYALVGLDSIWVSRDAEFLQIDPVTLAVGRSVTVTGHSSSEPGLIVGDELRAGTGYDVVLVSLTSGATAEHIPIHVEALFDAEGLTYGLRNGSLLLLVDQDGLVVDPESPAAATGLTGLPEPVGRAQAPDRLWLAGPAPGVATVVVEIDLSALSLVSRTPLSAGVRALQLAGSSLWVATMTGALVELAAEP